MKKSKFKELEAVPNFPEMEKETIEYWKKIDPVALLNKARASKEERVYYDGPITANGLPHYGHAITWTMKDVIPRHWNMKGYKVSRNMGWDCQGLPVEVEIEKELGFEKKEDIEKFGVAKFNELCRQSVLKHKDAMFEYEGRVGRWFDKDDMYYTMDRDYIESMWWSLKELYTKGLLYEGYKVVAYSTRAGCPLSAHEVYEGGYKEIEDPAVTVKFLLTSGEFKDSHLLAWTTTPWTLPGNLMLAVSEKAKYSQVEVDGQRLIVATDLVKNVFADKKYTILKTFAASGLVGATYKPLFNYFSHKANEGCFKVITADHVGVEEGTGVVHLAPYGMEDFDLFMKMNILLFDYLDEIAVFTDLVPDYAGLFYKQANPKIIEDLTTLGLMYKHEAYLHRMPMCWRTATPLIYKPVRSWYIATTKIKDKMLEQNQQINWLPEHLKNGLSKIWISNAYDWAISRTRYWGTPLPVWVNDKTGEKILIGSYAELKEYSGVVLDDPHKPYVDDVTWEDKKNGGTFRRVPDVVDVWYDSGAVPFAKLHYPFENHDRFEQTVPADYISEGTDQVRLWFYTMHVLGVALFGQVPYKNVVTTGMLNDKHDKKLSKSKKNYEPMENVLDMFGGDILRYFLLTSPVVQGENARFYNEVLVNVRKEFFIPLWNCTKFFTSYANANDFVVDSVVQPDSTNLLDKWIVARLQETVNFVVAKLDSYSAMEAARALAPFVTDLSTWYIRRSRDRLKEGDKEALATLYYVLVSFNKLMAPVLPFLSEVLFDVLNQRELTSNSTVHLELYPQTRELTSDELAILSNMKNTRAVVSLALGIRAEKGVRVRQTLNTLHVESTLENWDYYNDLVSDEVNVKNVTVVTVQKDKNFNNLPMLSDNDFKVYLDTTLTKELEVEGNAREMVRKIQDLRKEAKLEVMDKVLVTYEDTLLNRDSAKEFKEYIMQKVQATSLEPGEGFSVKKL